MIRRRGSVRRAPRRSHVSAPWLIWRQVSANVGASVTVAIVVFALAVLAAGVPRLITAMFNSSLQSSVASLPPQQRDLVGVGRGGPAAGASVQPGAHGLTAEQDAVWGRQEDALDTVRAGMSPPLRDVVGDAEYVTLLDAGASRPTDPNRPAPSSKLSMAFDPHLLDRVSIVGGTAPSPASALLLSVGVVDVILSRATAERLQLRVGDELRVELHGAGQIVRLAGIFEARDPRAEYWRHVDGSLEPTVLSAGMEPLIIGVAYADAASWPQAAGLSTDAATQVWFPVHADRFTTADASSVADALRAFTRLTHPIAPAGDTSFSPGPRPLSVLTFASRLGFTLQEVAERGAATSAVLALSVSGPIGVALVVLVLGSRLIIDRRNQGLALASARGATPLQVRTVLAAEGAVIGVPAAVTGTAAGTVVGALLVPAATAFPDVLLPVVIGIAPALLLAFEGNGQGVRRSRSDIGTAVSRRGWLLEVLIVGLAVASVVLLTQRGLTTSSAAVGVDPLLAGTPLLLSLAACVAVMRLYPAPLGMLSRRLKSGRGLAGFLGSVRALRDPAAGFAPVLALVSGVTVAVFSVGMVSTVQAGVDTAALARVGADLRVSAPYLSADQLAAVRGSPGVLAVTPVYAEIGSIMTIAGSRLPVSVLVVDAADLDRVQRGVPGALPLPAGLSTVVDDDIPVVVSADVAAQLDAGSAAELGGHTLNVVATAPSVSPLTTGRAWMLVDRANAATVVGYTPAPGVALVDLADAAHRGQVAGRIRSLLGTDAIVDSPAAVAATAGSDTTVGGLRIASMLAVLVAWLLTALAVVLMLVLGAPARTRMLALLRALGLERQRATALVGWEVGPAAVAALVVGTALGYALPFLVLAAVDLRPFTHGTVQPAVVLDPWLLVLMLGGFVLVICAGGWLALALARRTDAHSLRTIEEG
ncbi:FtsX-like permease family protein [Glaciibacter sp. 2TAF33]|uniref:FtsX-like permease family protein n=1 Tax=Glaciibacter sp. 2TAF33 TaxID=3233015 RepID=UPI003F92B463